MKPIKVWNLNIDVGMKPTGVADLNIEVKLNVILHFDPDAEVKTVDNEVRMKPPGQILLTRFHFFVEFAAKQYYICHWYTKTQCIEKT